MTRLPRTKIIDRALADALIDGSLEPCRNERCQIDGVHPAHDDVPIVGRPTESVLPPDLFLLVDDAIFDRQKGQP